jgi:hypothetical protein
MDDNKVVSIVPSTTDAEYAASLKKEVIVLYEPLLKLLTEANNKGFHVDVGCGIGPLGTYVITQLRIIKIFKDV